MRLFALQLLKPTKKTALHGNIEPASILPTSFSMAYTALNMQERFLNIPISFISLCYGAVL